MWGPHANPECSETLLIVSSHDYLTVDHRLWKLKIVGCAGILQCREQRSATVRFSAGSPFTDADAILDMHHRHCHRPRWVPLWSTRSNDRSESLSHCLSRTTKQRRR